MCITDQNIHFFKEMKYSCLQLEACRRMKLTKVPGSGLLPLQTHKDGGRDHDGGDNDEPLFHIIIKGSAKALDPAGNPIIRPGATEPQVLGPGDDSLMAAVSTAELHIL